MSRKSKRNSRRRSRRAQANGVIGDFVKKIPGIGPIAGPIIGGAEDFVVRLNRGSKKKNASGPIAQNGRMGVANVSSSQSAFRTWSTGNEMHVVGRDLVRPVPEALEINSLNNELFAVVTANPAYWTGTRIAQLAPGYQQYRPMAFAWEYIPQVAVTQVGSVVMGTLWDTSVQENDLQQTLVTSNGGCITQCYNRAARSVVLGSNLQYNLFQVSGFLSAQTNPFTFVAASQGTNSVVPGYFMVTYHYVFKNPIGSSWDFVADWNTTLKDSYAQEYVSAIPLLETPNVNPAEILQFRDGVWSFEDGTPLPLEDIPNLPVAVFACTPTSTSRAIDSVRQSPWPRISEPFTAGWQWVQGSSGANQLYTIGPYKYYTGPITVPITTGDTVNNLYQPLWVGALYHLGKDKWVGAQWIVLLKSQAATANKGLQVTIALPAGDVEAAEATYVNAQLFQPLVGEAITTTAFVRSDVMAGDNSGSAFWAAANAAWLELGTDRDRYIALSKPTGDSDGWYQGCRGVDVLPMPGSLPEQLDGISALKLARIKRMSALVRQMRSIGLTTDSQ